MLAAARGNGLPQPLCVIVGGPKGYTFLPSLKGGGHRISVVGALVPFHLHPGVRGCQMWAPH